MLSAAPSLVAATEVGAAPYGQAPGLRGYAEAAQERAAAQLRHGRAELENRTTPADDLDDCAQQNTARWNGRSAGLPAASYVCTPTFPPSPRTDTRPAGTVVASVDPSVAEYTHALTFWPNPIV